MYYAIVCLSPSTHGIVHPNFDTFTGCSSYYFDLLRSGTIDNYRIFPYDERKDPDALHAKYALIGRIMNAERDVLHGRLYTYKTMFETIDQLLSLPNTKLRECAEALEKQLEPAGERAPEIL